MNGYEALKRGRTTGINDLRGAHVVMDHQGRALLGTIVAQERLDDNARTVSFKVRHFNGEAWPLAWVPPGAVTVLERAHDNQQEEDQP